MPEDPIASLDVCGELCDCVDGYCNDPKGHQLPHHCNNRLCQWGDSIESETTGTKLDAVSNQIIPDLPAKPTPKRRKRQITL